MAQPVPMPWESLIEPPPNPATTTRRDFTAFHVRQLYPRDAAPAYSRLFIDMQHMLDLLAHNEAMRDNLEQTYSTPANKKSKVYFMWDFVGRTLGMLYQVNPKLTGPTMVLWNEVKGRNEMARNLIADRSQHAMIMAGQPDDSEFGEEIEKLAKTMGDT